MNTTGRGDKLSYNQVLLLITVYRLMIGLTYLPVVNITPANQDVWFIMVLSSIYTIIFCSPLLYLTDKFHYLGLIGYSEKIMGKYIGKIVGIFYNIFLFLSLLLFVGVLVEVLNSTLFTETPTIVTISIALVTSTYIASKGFRNIARVGEIVNPFIITMTFIFIILGYRNYDFHELLPVFKDSTFREINLGAMNVGIRFMDITILAILAPRLENRKYIKIIFVKSVLYFIIIGTLIVISIQMALGTEFVKHINFPFITFTRLLSPGFSIQGLDSLYMVAWIMGNILKISGYFYLTTEVLGELTKREHQIFKIPLAIIVLIIVLLVKDKRPILAAKDPIINLILVISIMAISIIPFIMLIVYFFRRKKLSEE